MTTVPRTQVNGDPGVALLKASELADVELVKLAAANDPKHVPKDTERYLRADQARGIDTTRASAGAVAASSSASVRCSSTRDSSSVNPARLATASTSSGRIASGPERR